jgi:hypothetical protein
MLAFANLAFAPVAASMPVAMDHQSDHCQSMQQGADHKGPASKAADADRCCAPALGSAIATPSCAVASVLTVDQPDDWRSAGMPQHLAGSDPPPPRLG